MLGDTILQKYYVAFDRENERIGFASALFEGNERSIPKCDNDLLFDIKSEVGRPKYQKNSPLPIIIATVVLLVSLYITRISRRNRMNKQGSSTTAQPVRSLQLPAYDIDDEHEIL